MSEIRSVVATWIKGWALARGVEAPVVIPGGYRVQVGWPEQKERYIFSEITPVFKELGNAVTEPWVFLKVCAHPDSVRAILPPRWMIQSPGYMMITDLVPEGEALLAGGYHLKAEPQLQVPVVHIFTDNGELAASGRIALVEDFAIYDRITTTAAHRRKGLATVVMKQLSAIARSRGLQKAFWLQPGKDRRSTKHWGGNCIPFIPAPLSPETNSEGRVDRNYLTGDGCGFIL